MLLRGHSPIVAQFYCCHNVHASPAGFSVPFCKCGAGMGGHLEVESFTHWTAYARCFFRRCLCIFLYPTCISVTLHMPSFHRSFSLQPEQEFKAASSWKRNLNVRFVSNCMQVRGSAHTIRVTIHSRDVKYNVISDLLCLVCDMQVHVCDAAHTADTYKQLQSKSFCS